MSNVLKYKGYAATIEYSTEDRLLVGRIHGLSDTLSFACESADEVEPQFHALIDDYLEMCKDIGKEPERQFSGSFNVRVTPDLHKKAYYAAMDDGISLNEWINKAVEDELVRQPEFIPSTMSIPVQVFSSVVSNPQSKDQLLATKSLPFPETNPYNFAIS